MGHLGPRYRVAQKGECRSQTQSTITRCRGNVDLLDGGFGKDTPVEKGIVGQPSGEDQMGNPMLVVKLVDDGENNLFGEVLHGGGDVFVTTGQFLLRISPRS